jgi:hypothetical protein
LRLESLDIDHPAEARTELDVLAEQLRSGGWNVEVAGPGEPTLSRFRESAEGAFVDVLNLVLDEAERHALDVVLAAIFAWAIDRMRFRGREGARPVVVIYVGGEDVREEPLPEPRKPASTGTRDETLGAPTLLFLFDVLGFSARVREVGLAAIYAEYERLLAMVTETGSQLVLDGEPDGQGSYIPVAFTIPWSMAYFSDTILLWTDYSRGPLMMGAAKSVACQFFCRCFARGLPLRGAMAAGPAVMDLERRIFLGEPLIDAARAEAAQHCAGIGIAASWEPYFGGALGRPELLLPYADHIKPGREDALANIVLDWPSAWRASEDFAAISLDRLIESYSRPGYEPYWEATRRLIAHSESKPDWQASDDSSGIDEKSGGKRPSTPPSDA